MALWILYLVAILDYHTGKLLSISHAGKIDYGVKIPPREVGLRGGMARSERYFFSKMIETTSGSEGKYAMETTL